MEEIEIVPVTALVTGDKFIWADDYTRRCMAVTIRNPHDPVLGPLRFATHYPSVTKMAFGTHTGEIASRYYDSKCKAIVYLSSGNICDYDVRCLICSERYGKHSGLNCTSGEFRGCYFVPSEQDLIKYHPGLFDNDFFADLGL